MPKNREAVMNLISSCESVAEFEEAIRPHLEHNPWSTEIQRYVKQTHQRTNGIAIAIGCSESTVKNHMKSIPKDRGDIIKMAALMGLGETQTNELLTIQGKKRALYAKIPEDFIWIHILSTGGSVVPDSLYQEYKAVYDRLLQEYQQFSGGHYRQKLQTNVLLYDARRTGRLRLGFSTSDAVFHNLLMQHIPDFGNPFSDLQRFLTRHLRRFLNLPGESVNHFFRSNPVFRSKYNEIIPALFKHGQLPDNRDFLIALGLWTNMNTEKINQMLNLAKMGPLDPKDLVESVILFHLEYLWAENPSVFFVGDCTPENGREFDVLDNGQELPDLHSYIRRGLETSNLIQEFGAEQKSRIDTFLKWL